MKDACMTVTPSQTNFPFTARSPIELPAEFAELRARCPVARVDLPSGDHAWLVTGYAEVRQLLAEPRLSRAAATKPDAPRLGPARPEPASMMAMDPPAHTRLRRLIAPAFSSGRAERLRPAILETTRRLLDELEAGGPPADLVTGLARPLPVQVIGELLGVPAADRATFAALTGTTLRLDAGAREQVVAAREQLHGYLAELVSESRNGSGDGLLATLAAARDHDGRLDNAELVTLASTLLTAGYHTIATAIANCTLVLLHHPDQWRLLSERPELLPAAIEELLRYTPGPVSGGTIRIATEDFDLGGVTIRSGEAVIPSVSAADRDPAVFVDPERLDVCRQPNPHLAFGPGIHHCVGLHLARLELNVAFGALVSRFPGLRLAVPLAEIPREGGMIRGIAALPVVW
jgi:cytochrome P450